MDSTVPEYSGRAVVGWVGVGMSILALTGIWLWWPRGTGSFVRGLRWARSPRFTFNLHHLLGFWISIPLGGGLTYRDLFGLSANWARHDVVGRGDEPSAAARWL